MATTMLAKAKDSSRPEFLVVFEESSEKNVHTLSSTLNLGPSRGGGASKGAFSLLNVDSGKATKIYEGLGAAATDLTADQRETLEKRADVQTIVENKVRSLPKTLRGILTEDDDRPTASKDPLVAYLQGLRDAANMAIAYQEGRDFVPITPTTVGIASTMAARYVWGLKAIGVAPAFSGPTGKGIKIAVLDTGIDLTHPDLKNKVVKGKTAVSFTGVPVQDIDGHGSHCAGIISGPSQSVNGRRYGVAPEVSLLVGKVFDNDPEPGAYDDDILDGMQWAVDQGARIISMSLGTARDVGDPYDPLYEALAKKFLNRDKNSVLIIAAAGNESDRPNYTAPVCNPAACPSIMSVAAVDKWLKIADFSCAALDKIGAVDVSGPGVSIYSSYTGGGFDTISGTSMATPYVAGMAALYLEQDPKLSAKQLFSELQKRARSLGNPKDFGAGLIRL